MAPAMPCKRDNQHLGIVKTNMLQKNVHEKELKTMYGCIVESHESTGQRAESLQSKKHEDRIAGKGFFSVTHYNLVHKFIPMPQSMKILDAKAAVDKEWKKLDTIPAWNLEKVKTKKEAVLEAQRDNKKVHFASLMDICTSKKCRDGTNIAAQRQSRAYAVFTEQGSSASQMTAAKFMDVIAILPGCDGQATDVVSAYTHVNWTMLLNCPKFRNHNVEIVWIRLPRHKWSKSWE